VLKKFNGGKEISHEVREEIQNHFEFYWGKDKNFAKNSADGERFMSEIPKGTLISLYKEFLFKDFLETF
jgi:hypothetical protein